MSSQITRPPRKGPLLSSAAVHVGIIALAFTIAGAPASAQAEPLVDPHPEDRILIQVDPKLDDAALVRKWLDDEARRVFEASEVPLVPSAGDPRRLVIEVGGASYDFRYRVGVVADSSSSPTTSHTCACAYEELIEAVRGHVVEAVPELQASEPEEAQLVASPPAPEPEPGVTPVGMPSDPPRPQRTPLKPLGRAGIGMLVPGIVLTAAGGALVGVGTRDGEGGKPFDRERVDYRPVGGTLLGIGLATATTGAVLLIIDRVRGRSSSTSARKATPMFGVAPQRGGAAARVTFSF